MKHFEKFMPLFCALSASMVLVACAETECVDTDAGGVCVTESYDDGYYYDSLVTGVKYENKNEDGDVVRTAVNR